MPETLTETSTFDSAIVVPVGGDRRNAQSVRAAFLSLANRTKYLKSNFDTSINYNIGGGFAGLRGVSPLVASFTGGARVFIDRRSAEGDGGGGTFVALVGAAPGTYTDDDGITLLSSGSDGSHAWRRVYEGNIQASWFGAHPSYTNNSAAIVAAVTAAANAGGGVVELDHDGTYDVSASGGSSALLFSGLDGWSLSSRNGKATVRLKANESTAAHTISIVNCTNVTIRDIQVDGNRANQTVGGHGIRAEEVSDFRILRSEIRNTFQYGIGLQDGLFLRVLFEDSYIHNTGRDGIDCKNKDNEGDGNTQLRMSNMIVENWGVDTSQSTQAAIDTRGPWTLNNIFVSTPGKSDGVGVRFRQGTSGTLNGPGGHRSSLTNFEIQMGSNATAAGLSISGDYVAVSNGTITGGGFAVQVRSKHVKLTAITSIDALTRGFDLTVPTADDIADDCTMVDCEVLGTVTRAFEIEASRAILTACRVDGAATGVYIATAADSTPSYTQIVGGSIRNTTTRPLTAASGVGPVDAIGVWFDGNSAAINDPDNIVSTIQCRGEATNRMRGSIISRQEYVGNTTIANTGKWTCTPSSDSELAPAGTCYIGRTSAGTTATSIQSNTSGSQVHQATTHIYLRPANTCYLGWNGSTVDSAAINAKCTGNITAYAQGNLILQADAAIRLNIGDLVLSASIEQADTGTDNAWTLTKGNVIYWRGTSNLTVNGIDKPSTSDEGKTYLVICDSANILTFTNNSGSATTGEKILSVTGSDAVFSGNEMGWLHYDKGADVWRVGKLS